MRLLSCGLTHWCCGITDHIDIAQHSKLDIECFSLFFKKIVCDISVPPESMFEIVCLDRIADIKMIPSGRPDSSSFCQLA